MVTKELVDYLKAELQRGVVKDDLVKVLVTQGWILSDVQEAFRLAVPAPVPAPVAAPTPAAAPVLVPIAAPVIVPLVIADIAAPAVSSPAPVLTVPAQPKFVTAQPAAEQVLPQPATPSVAAPIKVAPIEAAPIQAAAPAVSSPAFVSAAPAKSEVVTPQPAVVRAPLQATVAAAVAPMRVMPIQASPVQTSPIPAAPIQVQSPASASSEYTDYAGFWRRFAATLIDGVIFQILGLGAAYVLMMFFSAYKNELMVSIGGPLVILIIAIIYFAGLESSSMQGTFGKKLAGIVVTDLYGNRISFLRAVGRYFAKFLSCILFVGFIMAAFTEKKQGLHDMIAGTLVLRKGDSHIGKIIIGIIIALILAAGSIFAVGYYMKSQLEGMFTFLAPMQDNKPAAAAISLEESEYDEYLSASVEGLEAKYDGAVTRSGPVFIAFDSMWLDVAIPVIPNVEGVSEQSHLTFKHIWSKDGRDIYDRESTFEKDLFFTDLGFKKIENPLHLHATRSASLVSGTKDSDIAKIEGTVILKLPVGKSFIEKTYPFTLVVSPGTSTATSTGAAKPAAAVVRDMSKGDVTPAMKEDAAAGILRTKAAMSSKDPAVIRNYFMAMLSDDPDQVAEIRNLSDKEALSTAALFGYVYEDISPAALRSDKATWTLVSPLSVEVAIEDELGEVEVEVKKVKGIWY